VAQPSKPTDKNLQTLVTELWDLLVRYAKQEALDPLKTLLRFLAWGLAGSVLLALGLVLLGLAVLRALETELSPHLSGNWSWVPYSGVIVFGAVVMAILGRAIGADKRRVERERASLRGERG
jgi:hypothetical protein